MYCFGLKMSVLSNTRSCHSFDLGYGPCRVAISVDFIYRYTKPFLKNKKNFNLFFYIETIHSFSLQCEWQICKQSLSQILAPHLLHNNRRQNNCLIQPIIHLAFHLILPTQPAQVLTSSLCIKRSTVNQSLASSSLLAHLCTKR